VTLNILFCAVSVFYFIIVFMIFPILLLFPGLCKCLVTDFFFAYLRYILMTETTSLSSCFSSYNSLTPINISFHYCSWYLDWCIPKFTYTSIVVLYQLLTILLAHNLSLISSFVQDVLSFIVCSTGLILFSWLYMFRAVLSHCLCAVELPCQ